jgi:hypothetical protein
MAGACEAYKSLYQTPQKRAEREKATPQYAYRKRQGHWLPLQSRLHDPLKEDIVSKVND